MDVVKRQRSDLTSHIEQQTQPNAPLWQLSRYHLPAATFITKLRLLVDDPKCDHAIGWTDDGQAIIVRNLDAFTNQVLCAAFKTRNIASFVRQLNMYGFNKANGYTRQVKGRRPPMIFRNAFFVRDNVELMAHVRRMPLKSKSKRTAYQSAKKKTNKRFNGQEALQANETQSIGGRTSSCASQEHEDSPAMSMVEESRKFAFSDESCGYDDSPSEATPMLIWPSSPCMHGRMGGGLTHHCPDLQASSAHYPYSATLVDEAGHVNTIWRAF